MSTKSIADPAGPARQRYLTRSAGSRDFYERVCAVMPGGSTRSHAFFLPYPLVFERGEGPYLYDVDGNRYVDYTYNGLSLIHGYAYKPVERALVDWLPNGTAWVGPSLPLLDFAEDLLARIPHAELMRFTNTGTEATMLATKLARRATGRPLILKSWGAYHGSYDDLEAGLHGIGELPGRAVLADFGDLASYEEAFARHGEQIAAVLIEPVLLTFNVVAPPDGFLPALADLARSYGALVVLDDCLMFRLAVGGSAEKYGFRPDLTCLGKFIGGGVPMGVVAGRDDVLGLLDPRQSDALYHGGSFNGNPLAAIAGRISLADLTAERIAAMDAWAERLRTAMRDAADDAGLPLSVTGDGSVLGRHVLAADGTPDADADAYLHFAAVGRGVFPGPDGEMAMCTVLGEEAVEHTIAAMSEAIAETAAWIEQR